MYSHFFIIPIFLVFLVLTIVPRRRGVYRGPSPSLLLDFYRSVAASQADRYKNLYYLINYIYNHNRTYTKYLKY